MQPKGAFSPLIRKSLSRHWLLLLVVFLFLLSFATRSIDTLFSYRNGSFEIPLHENDWQGYLKNPNLGMLEFFTSAIAALCAFSYLHRKKEAHFFQSIPLKKDRLFFSSLLSGLLFYVLPWLVVTAFSVPLISYGANGDSLIVGHYVHTLLLRLTLYLVGYSMAVLAAILCGRRAFAVYVTFLLHALFPMLESIVYIILQDSLYGLSIEQSFFTMYFSPFFYLSERFLYNYNVFLWDTIGIYAGVALLLMALCAFLHRKRREEYVGQSLVFPTLTPWLQALFTLLFAFVGATVLVNLEILPHKEDELAYPCLLLCPLAFFLCRMLLLRSRKVFQKKAFLQCGVLTLCLLVAILTFQFDLPGIVRKIPKAEDVDRLRIEMNSMCFVAEDPKDIEDFLPIHRLIVQNRKLLYYDASTDYSMDTDVRYLNLTYERKGPDLVRTYALVYSEDRYDFVLDALDAYFQENDRAAKHILQLQEETEYIDFSRRPPHSDLVSASFTLSSAQTDTLFQALLRDMREGKESLLLQRSAISDAAVTFSIRTGGYRIVFLSPELEHAHILLNALETEYRATLNPF